MDEGHLPPVAAQTGGTDELSRQREVDFNTN